MPADELPPDDLKKLNEWKKKFKDEWDYRRKLVIFEGSDGVLITPTTRTRRPVVSTVPVTVPVTSGNNSPFSAVVTVNTTDTVTPRAGGLVTADTQQLLTVVGITCASFIAIILVVLVIILVCRRSSKKRDQNISIRRPLNGPEPEDHIYAEIEPLQLQRGDSSSGGASGGTVHLPSKKHKKRLRGVSSFRAISMRIQRLFNVEQSPHTQSVFYNRSEERPVVQNEPPEAPRRNIVNGSPAKSKRGKGKGVKRFESQSRRPLLDGDSQISTTSSSADANLRDNIYNPLLRNNETRASGPYDHLHLIRTRSGQDVETEVAEPTSPHDYFRLEATNSNENPLLQSEIPVEMISEDDTNEIGKPQDYFVLEKETAKSAQTENNASETPDKHDYFILEPQLHTKGTDSSGPSAQIQTEVSVNPCAESSDKHRLEDLSKDMPVKKSKSPGKTKPTAKPRNTISPSSENKPSVCNPNSPSEEQTNIHVSSVNNAGEREGNTYVEAPGTSPMPSRREIKEIDTSSAIAGKKNDEHELYKLGKAPVPPSPEVDDYLEPLVATKEVYIDVYPTPPPRSTSVQSDSPGRQRGSLDKQQEGHGRSQTSPVKHHVSPVRHESPIIKSGSPVRQLSPIKHQASPIRQGSPEKHVSPSSQSGSPVRQRSPVKHQTSPVRKPSPVKKQGSSVKQGSPVKTHESPAKQLEESNLHVETDI